MNQGATLFGIKLAAASSATTLPFLKVITSLVMFLSITVTFCEPGKHTEYVGIVITLGTSLPPVSLTGSATTCSLFTFPFI